ncbi:MAG: CinA family protein, partial [Bacteroidales bacterium]|nr:CinA family protein [Bacteroidales bacterium]
SSTIRDKGVVSAEVASAMAEGVRDLTGSTFAVSTTGLAEGSDDYYPEGTVWIGVAGPEGTRTLLYQWNKDRKANIRRFAVVALRFLLKIANESKTKR